MKLASDQRDKTKSQTRYNYQLSDNNVFHIRSFTRQFSFYHRLLYCGIFTIVVLKLPIGQQISPISTSKTNYAKYFDVPQKLQLERRNGGASSRGRVCVVEISFMGFGRGMAESKAR